MSGNNLKNPTVIVLGTDTPIGVSILRDLGRHDYFNIGIGNSKNSIGFYSRYCHMSFIRPLQETQLVEELIALGKQFPGTSLIAISEHDNLLVNRHRTSLLPYLQLVVPEQDLLNQVHNKSRCLAIAKDVGIRVPETHSINTVQEAESLSLTLSYPQVLKWSDPNEVIQLLNKNGIKSHKYQYANDPKDLIDKLRPYSTIGKFPLIQEYCPGKGLGQMFLFRKGKCILEFQHSRINEWPPEGGTSTYCKSVPLHEHENCRQKSIALLERLRWDGVAMVEYRYDVESNTYYFMEINGRFWGSLPLAINAGVSFPAGLLNKGGDNQHSYHHADYPEIYCRFMLPEIRRLLTLLFNQRKIQDPYFQCNRFKEIFKFIHAFIRPKTSYFLFSRDDPGPFLADIRNILLKVVKH